MSKKKKSVAKLKKELDSWFSKYIRLKNSFYSGGELSCTCATCGSTKPVKSMQNGHFMSRQHNSTRYEEKNCSPQCYGCNVMQQGKQYEHGMYLEKVHGKGTAKAMYMKSKELKQWKAFELEEMIAEYKGKVKELEGR